MKQYFKNHPTINYNGQQLRNLLSSAQITKEVLQETSAFLPYTIQDGETLTSVAFNYYGSIDYAWLVLFSNQNAVDPYTFWPKTEEQLQDFIIHQYGSSKAGYTYIHHFNHVSDPSYPPVTKTTYDFMSVAEKAQFVPVYVYEYLSAENDRKRQINLIDKVYAARISLELEKKLSA